ncbi:aromatic-ring-hydroxylating dioxygenase subunit beta [Nocardioides sp. LHG3406-4]|uniref:aromatic-ring-hydroxylating dioxygenase subunit beta n=1 Tax=Nocardioides sp. LHG3406-4 TaxID=2804575 RepID=UPI003CF91628
MTAFVDPSSPEGAVVEFIYHETHLLNSDRYAEWIQLLGEEFEYRMPNPQLRDDPRAAPYSDKSLLSWESIHSLRLRFDRLASEFAWADRPPAFHRRHLTAVRVEALADGETWNVSCDELVARSRTPEPPQLVSALREDVVQRVGGDLRLARRTVFLDVDRPDLAQIALLF